MIFRVIFARSARAWAGMLFLTMLVAGGAASAQNAPVLEVKVGPGTVRRLGPADLATLPQTEVVETRGVGTGSAADITELRWRGVLLRDIFNAAGLQQLDRRELRRSAMLARASDGYVVLFSWGEIFNAKSGDNVLVITSLNGKALPLTEGPYALRSLSDTKSGPRHVKWLQQLELITVPK